MSSLLTRVLLLASALLFVPEPLITEEMRQLPDPPVFSIPKVQNSGYVFAGTVKAVERIAPQGSGVLTMQITFHVDDGIRGVKTGQILVIREWAGLWQLGERYRPGEGVLLFLYPPSKLGLTSPVGGSIGRYRLDHGGRVILPQARTGIRRNVHGQQQFNKAEVDQDMHLSPREFLRTFRHYDEE